MEEFEELGEKVLKDGDNVVTLEKYIELFTEAVKEHIDSNYEKASKNIIDRKHIININIPEGCVFKIDDFFVDPRFVFFEYRGFILSRVSDEIIRIVNTRNML